MNEICEIIPSQKGHNKINVRGYLMVKERNRDDKFYWCCEKRKLEGCKGRATTILNNGLHYLKKIGEHNHAPQASSANVAKAIAEIKKKAGETREKPMHIIQNHMINISEDVHPYMPSHNALRKKIIRIRKVEIPPKPQSIDEVNIPASLCVTLNGEHFLVKDHINEHERILMFTTKNNIQYLSQAIFWIADGAFKIVSTIFYQLFTIYAPVGTDDNSRILPLVYVLMTSKTEKLYRRLFDNLLKFAEENGVYLSPSYIITDFEQAVINSTRYEFPDITSKGYFFRLGQNYWRKIRDCGLAIKYGNDEQFSLMLRHLYALSFLPPQEIPAAFDILKSIMPQEANEVVQWFEENYVSGRIIRQMRNGNVTRDSPPFPPALWSVYDAIKYGILQTENAVEAWHHRWETLIEEANGDVCKIIEELQKGQQEVEVQVECIAHGERRPKQKKRLIDRENRIMMIINNRETYSLIDFLREVAHNLTL
ncbi:unnamed protein product [Rhizophagus irregularis]|uniref:FLYWCH-type domain-containing protein n=1 Tax=Rhizophagus irregularis TaxID=588596 RepID=A0A2N1NXT0_9GLOM|nr:hypothetical protein RhiirC2_831844 [Rhizophagus irregularis]CAB4377153.1 unnamed protein product [Rhizophagus irregularis]CAB5394283.1 unnamed protein product [Rhizophagus irregularis]